MSTAMSWIDRLASWDDARWERRAARKRSASAPRIVMIIRHGEKPADPNDHGLSDRGLERARKIAGLFTRPTSSLEVAGLYQPKRLSASRGKTKSLRMIQTLADLSVALALPIDDRYDAEREYRKYGRWLAAQTAITLACLEHTAITRVVKAMGKVRGAPKGWPGDRFDVVLVLYSTDGGKTWMCYQVPELLLAGDRPTGLDGKRPAPPPPDRPVTPAPVPGPTPSPSPDPTPEPGPSPGPVPPDKPPGRPGDLLDLRSWKLTYTTAGPDAELVNLGPPEILTANRPPYFTMVRHPTLGPVALFDTTAGGATTAHSTYSRSELRELTPGGKPAAWSVAKGVHRLSLFGAVLAMPDDPRESGVVIAQIHDTKANNDQLEILRGTDGRMFMRVNGKSAGLPLLDVGWPLGKLYHLELLSSVGITDIVWNGSLIHRTSEIAGPDSYYKAGCYLNCHKGRARVAVKFLAVTHL